MLVEAVRASLRRVALEAVTAAAHERTPPQDSDPHAKSVDAAAPEDRVDEATGDPSSALGQRRAAFVSVYVGDRLRGCMGSLATDRPLVHVVAEMAAAAATRDDRFPAVRPHDVPRVRVEISVLGPMTSITGPDDLVIGRDGLFLRQGSACGLLLPQVPVRYGWSVRELLEQTAQKAGLAPEAWRISQLHRFEAEVF